MLDVITNNNLFLSHQAIDALNNDERIEWQYGVDKEQGQLTGKIHLSQCQDIEFVAETNKLSYLKKYKQYPYALTKIQWHQNGMCHRDKGPASIHYDQVLKQKAYFWYKNGEKSSYRRITAIRQVNDTTKEIYFVNDCAQPVSIEKMFYHRSQGILLKWYHINEANYFLPCVLGFNQKSNKLISANFTPNWKNSLKIEQTQKLQELATEYNVDLFNLDKQTIPNEFMKMLKMNFLTT